MKPLLLMIRLIRRVGLLSAPILVLGGLSGCARGVLDPVGPIGASELVILIDATVIMLAVIIPVIFLTLAFSCQSIARSGGRVARLAVVVHLSARVSENALTSQF